MSAHILLNLLNLLSETDKIRGFAEDNTVFSRRD